MERPGPLLLFPLPATSARAAEPLSFYIWQFTKRQEDWSWNAGPEKSSYNGTKASYQQLLPRTHPKLWGASLNEAESLVPTKSKNWNLPPAHKGTDCATSFDKKSF